MTWRQTSVLILLFAARAWAQPAGEIHLTVTDPSGAGLEAAGRLRGSLDRTFRTNALGTAALSGIPLGHYRIEISRPGFLTQTLAADVTTAAPLSLAVALPLAPRASSMDVVETTPLAGSDLSPEQIAAPVQVATAADIVNSGALSLPDFLSRRINGVSVNDMQGNPFQPDVNYRGYTASPLLGTPVGLSVFVDGVRQNQPFGDVVNWDLIPRNAIAEVALLPGSDPLFGLNTLGGALSVRTKDGLSAPGLDGTATWGASGRKALEAAYGGFTSAGWNWFFSGTGFHESGWRIDSPSDVRQFFGRLGRHTETNDFSLTASWAGNTLTGNGLQDYRLLSANYSSVYTIPDVNADRSPSVSLLLRHRFSDALNVSATAWYRNIRMETANPNFNTDVLGNSIYQPSASEIAALTAAGYSGFPTSGATAANTPFPKWRCIANTLLRTDPDERCDAVLIHSKEVQNDAGVSGQLSWLKTADHLRSRFATGFTVARGTVAYTQNTSYGYINPDYTITAVPAWQDGSTTNPVDSRVSLGGATPLAAIFVTDTFTVLRSLSITLSGRYSRASTDDHDRIRPFAGPGSLTGAYVFSRFSPAMGLAWNSRSGIGVYAGYTQSSRAPTSIELGCADPANPCSLPNALAGDPPLLQVVTGTWEAGVRGRHETAAFLRNLDWNLGAFRAENRNDILFVASPTLGSGYFRNFARTRREGLQASVSAAISRVTAGLDYTYLDATYQSSEYLEGGWNSSSDSAQAGYPGLDGVITVHPGNHIPLLAPHSGKAYADIRVTKKFAVNLDLVAFSRSCARGNENNAYRPDGVYYLGNGFAPGYSVTSLRAVYDLPKHLRLAVEVDNLFGRHYFTAGQLGTAGFNASGAVVTRPFNAYTKGPYAGDYPMQTTLFESPGAPRRAWVELGLRF